MGHGLDGNILGTKELPETRWCQNNQIFEGFSDFQKINSFHISGFFGFLAISGMKRATGDLLVSKQVYFQGLFRFSRRRKIIFRFLDYLRHIGNEMSYQKSVVVKAAGCLRVLQIAKNNLDFGLLELPELHWCRLQRVPAIRID